MKKVSLLVFFLFMMNANAQTALTHRSAFTLEMPINGAEAFKMEVPQKPYFVKDLALQLYPFEKIFLEVEIRKDTVYTMTVVAKNTNPKKTVEIEFQQNAHDGQHDNMILSVKNPFKKPLVYTAEIYTFTNRKWIESSTMPVAPKSSGYEIWKDAILTMVLKDWAFEE